MELCNVLNLLGYSDSPNFLVGESLEKDRDFGHIFRKAQDECRLQGVYLLNASAFDQSQSNVPVVYVSEADSEAEARTLPSFRSQPIRSRRLSRSCQSTRLSGVTALPSSFQTLPEFIEFA